MPPCVVCSQEMFLPGSLWFIIVFLVYYRILIFLFKSNNKLECQCLNDTYIIYLVKTYFTYNYKGLKYYVHIKSMT